MTDTPKTLALDAHEWGALVSNNIARAADFAKSRPIGPNDEEAAAMIDHLERMKALVVAWKTASAAARTQIDAAQARPTAEPAAPLNEAANGAAAPKKRGGWPRGKSRKRLNPAPQNPVQ